MNPRPGALQLIGVIFVAAFLLDGIVVFVFNGMVNTVPFITFTMLVAVASALAVLAPREVGHALAALMGVAAIAGSIGAFAKGMPAVLPTTLLITGGLMGVMVVFSMQKSRASWAFLTSTCAVLFICMFFGAPKVKGALGIGIWTALIIPGLLATAMIALAVLHRDYVTDEGTAKPHPAP